MNRPFLSESAVDSCFRNGRIIFPLMRKVFFLLLLGQWFLHGASAATMYPGSELSFSGVSFDSRQIRPGQLFVPIVAGRDGHDFVSDALANGAAAYLGGTAAAAYFDARYDTAHIGLRIQAIDSFIADLNIIARGTYAVQAPVLDSWASVFGQIPFSMQVLAVNGVPYSGTDLSRSYALQVSPSSVSMDFPGPALDQNGQPIPSSGNWTAQWSITGIASSLAGIFQLGSGQNITELDVAVTPDISTAAGGNGTGTIQLEQVKFTPTPEPSSLTLVGLAAWALLASRRRRR